MLLCSCVFHINIHYTRVCIFFRTTAFLYMFWWVRASVLLGKRRFAAKLTFTGVCHPPVILSTPSLCGVQPSKTSDRQSNGGGGLQQHNTLSLPSLCPAVRFNAYTHTHGQTKKGHICNKSLLFALWPSISTFCNTDLLARFSELKSQTGTD